MPQVKFKYDINKDAWAWVRMARKKELWGVAPDRLAGHIPEEVLNQLREFEYEKALQLAKETIRGINKEKNDFLIKSKIKWLEENWRPVEDKYFQLLSDLLQKERLQVNWTAYLTTVLLNQSQFLKITNYQDQGYPKHQQLRKKIFSFYEKTKDFDKLIKDFVKNSNF